MTIIRLVWLNTIPATLNPDEASIALNAYLLAETGKDEWGVSWPMVLDAFGDQKVIGYTSLVVPLLKWFNASDSTVRLPSALAGVLVVVIAGIIPHLWQGRWLFTLLVMSIIGLQPVFIWYSRMAFEANVALVYSLLLIVVLLMRPVSRASKIIQAGLIPLLIILACFTYNSPLLLVPALLLLLPIYQGFKSWRSWIIPLTLGFMAWVGCALVLSQLSVQKSQITIFNDPTIINDYGAYRFSLPSNLQSVVGNKYVYYAKIITANFIDSFSPRFLLFNHNGHPWHAIPSTGYLTVSVYAFGWIGLYLLLSKIWQQRFTLSQIKPEFFLVYITLVSLLPSVITVNSPHATRSLLFFVAWSILAAMGCYKVFKLLSSKINHKMVSTIIFAILIVPSIPYLQTLFIDYPTNPKLQAPLKPGIRQLINHLDENYPDESITMVDGAGLLYASVAWYSKISASEFRETIVKQDPDSINFKYGEKVGRFRFVRELQDATNDPIVVYWNGQQLQWIVRTSQE